MSGHCGINVIYVNRFKNILSTDYFSLKKKKSLCSKIFVLFLFFGIHRLELQIVFYKCIKKSKYPFCRHYKKKKI